MLADIFLKDISSYARDGYASCFLVFLFDPIHEGFQVNVSHIKLKQSWRVV